MVKTESPSVLFITRKWQPAVGGMETYSVRLTEELSKRIKCRVIALSGKDDGRPPSGINLLGLPFTVLKRWLLLKDRPSIIHLADMAIWPLALTGWLSLKRPAIVLSAHGTDVSYHRRGGLRGGLYGLYLRIGAFMLRRATVLANSRATAVVLKETGWKNATVIPLATDLTGVRVNGNHNERVLYAGRLIKLKGFSWFVDNVLPMLPEECEMDVAGTIWDQSEAASLNNPRVRYLGALSQTDLADAYQSALCVVVPNILMDDGTYEGFGLVAPEVASSGGVVVASRCDGLIDAVIDGETGILVEQGCSNAWAETILAIKKWSKEKRAGFIRSAQATAQRHYSWSRVAEATLAAYRNAAG